MTAMPPGPFHFETTALPGEHEGTGHVYLCDANGRKIAALWGPKETKIAMANFIIEAEANKSPSRTGGSDADA